MTSYLVQQYLGISAKEVPSKVALFFQGETIFYKELHLFSNKLANCLGKNGVNRGDRVAFILPKSINFIKAMLGILKADAAYVPIDGKAPMARAAEILEDCSPSVIICDTSTIEMAQSLTRGATWQPKIFAMSYRYYNFTEQELIWQEDIERERDDEPTYLNIDRDPAYILYTSGSTGKPKGVIVSHLNILSYIDWAVDYFDIKPNDNILNTSPLHFDMSVFDIYCSLKTGASLTLVPKNIQLFPIRLIDIMEKREITIWKGVSSLLAYFVKARALKPERLRNLKKVIFSGETLPTKYLISWMTTYPEKEFYNAYGPTEATGISTCYKVENIPLTPNDTIPIGAACSNTEIFAVREDGGIARVGEIGELYIRGSCLSQGYWNDRYRTEQAFGNYPYSKDNGERVYRTGDLVKLLSDGNYIFVGRKDDQIKYMGYRIELGEIEAALNSLDYVNDAAVISASMEDQENPEIIAFIGVNHGAALDGIREALKKRLPAYMQPHKIQVVRKLPRTENGKVDKQNLKNSYLTS